MVNLTKTALITKQYIKQYKTQILIITIAAVASVLYELLSPTPFASTLLISSVILLTCIVPTIKVSYPSFQRPISNKKWGFTMFVSILISYQVLAWQIQENTDMAIYFDIMKYSYIVWIVIAVFGSFMLHGYSRDYDIPYHVNLLTLAGIIISIIDLSFFDIMIWMLIYFLFVDAGAVVPFLIFLPLKRNY